MLKLRREELEGPKERNRVFEFSSEFIELLDQQSSNSKQREAMEQAVASMRGHSSQDQLSQVTGPASLQAYGSL